MSNPAPPSDPLPEAGLAPVHDPRARVLILGSFPGVASLGAQRYYAHPRNQFWPILGELTGAPLPALPYAERLQIVRDHGIAIWDVVGQCSRVGSLDSAIRDAFDNEFGPLLTALPNLVAVAFNGARAARAAPRFDALGYATHRLPSTSPAHAGMRYAQKLAVWRVLAPLLINDRPNLSPRPPAPG